MKFRTVFIIFNLFLVLFLVILVFIPLFLLGLEMALVFWQGNWFLILILGLLLGVFDTYFIINGRLYSLLEKEDWPALVHYLEDLILRKGKYRPHLVKLLADTYLVLSDTAAVINLENKADLVRPSLVDENVLVFGTARILGKDIPGAVVFFESHLAGARPALRPWVRWYYGFTLLLSRKYGAGADEFVSLARSPLRGSSNAVIAGLSAYILQESIARILPSRAEELRAAAEEGAERVKVIYPKHKDWIKETGRLNTEIHTAALVKYLEETGNWLYNLPTNHENV